MTVYGWKSGTRFKRNVAQAVGDRLDDLRLRNGGLRPEDVVADAKPDDSPLHPLFEWDDTTAANGYRLVQAREVIRSIVVVSSEDSAHPDSMRAFVRVSSVGEDDERGAAYTHIDEAMANTRMREEVLSRAKGELAAWSKRYRQLQELASVHAAIEVALDERDEAEAAE
jgi:hypothetical protein